jgi:hypothetical protein
VRAGQTVIAGNYSTGGGDLIATLSSPGSDMRLTVTDPDGLASRAQGAGLVTVWIPSGPPGSYRAEVTALGEGEGGETYAVTFVVANACHSAQGHGYLRKVQSAKAISDSVKIAQVGDVTVTPVTQSGKVLVEGAGRVAGAQTTVTALIYAAPPRAQLQLLSLKFQGLRAPTRAVLSQASAKQVAALDAGFKVDRVYACSDGVALEGPST